MNQITIVDTTPRDGIQTLKYIELNDKLKLIEHIVSSGIKRIEVTSIVNAKIVPQYKDAPLLMKALKNVPGVIYSVFAADSRRAGNALELGAGEISFFLTVCEHFAKRNVNKSVDRILNDYTVTAGLCREKGVRVRANIAMAFGSPFDESVDVKRTAWVAEKISKIGADEIVLCDSVALGNSQKARELLDEIERLHIKTPLAFHIHERNDEWKQMIKTALDRGVRVFDSTLLSLGGCPFTDERIRNISTLSLVEFIETLPEGFRTGIDKKGILEAEGFLGSVLQKD
jgi:hydroxymethylglutaryl-CoA lyase